MAYIHPSSWPLLLKASEPLTKFLVCYMQQVLGWITNKLKCYTSGEILCHAWGQPSCKEASANHTGVLLSLVASGDSTSLCAEVWAENSVLLLVPHLVYEKYSTRMCNASLFQALLESWGLCLFRTSVWIHLLYSQVRFCTTRAWGLPFCPLVVIKVFLFCKRVLQYCFIWLCANFGWDRVNFLHISLHGDVVWICAKMCW